MVGLLIAATCLVKPDLELDLFVVANNPSQMTSLEWLDNQKASSPIEHLLQPKLTELAKQSRPFIVVDGGDTSLLSKPAQPQVRVLLRDYESLASRMPSPEAWPVKRTAAQEKQMFANTQMHLMYIVPYGKSYGVSKSYLHLSSPGKPMLVLLAMNSYRNSATRSIAQDKKDLNRALAISLDSVRSTQETIQRDIPTFEGVVICAWGRPMAEANLGSFPPAGVVGHYKLSDTAGKLSLSWIEYIR